MAGDSIQEQYEQFKDSMCKLRQAILKVCGPLLKLIDVLEPYQKFEILHPRKKPRGSIRRSKKKMTDLDKQKYIVCCPLCDNEKCVRGTDKCEAEQWKKRKVKEMESEGRI